MSEKISMPISNDFCPQTLFCYGTYCDDGRPDFGLFCWFSYTWDSELGVMMCIGDEKQTKDNILKNRYFSANLVTEKLLPLADHLGNADGRDPGKITGDIAIEKGQKLDVPILADSPVVFELEAVRTVPLDGGEVFLCKIRNLLMDKPLTDRTRSIGERINEIAPVSTTFETYFSWEGKVLGEWGNVTGVSAK